MKKLLPLVFMLFILNGCSNDNEASKSSSSQSNNSVQSMNLPKEETDLITQLNNLPIIPKDLIGTREGESSLSKFNELKSEWETQNSQPNRIGILEIKDWLCVVKNYQIPNLGDKQLSCELPGMTMERLMNGTGSDGHVSIELLNPLSDKVYSNDKILVSGRISRVIFNTIVNTSVYQVQIFLDNGSYTFKK